MSIQDKLPVTEKATTIPQLFHQMNPLFTFIDYTLLDYLIMELGSETLKINIKSYVQDIQKFMRETTVAEIIPHWPGSEVSSEYFQQIWSKIGRDYTKYTLEELNKIFVKNQAFRGLIQHRKTGCSQFILCCVAVSFHSY